MPNVAVNDYHALIVLIDHKQQGALVDSKLSPEIGDIEAELQSHATYFSEGFVRIRTLHSNQGSLSHTRTKCTMYTGEEGLGPVMQSKMMDMAIRNNFKLKEIMSDLGLPALGGEWDDSYFYAEIPVAGRRQISSLCLQCSGDRWWECASYVWERN